MTTTTISTNDDNVIMMKMFASDDDDPAVMVAFQKIQSGMIAATAVLGIPPVPGVVRADARRRRLKAWRAERSAVDTMMQNCQLPPHLSSLRRSSR